MSDQVEHEFYLFLDPERSSYILFSPVFSYVGM